MANANEKTLVKQSVGTDYPYPTTTDLTALQYHFVKVDGDELITGASGAGETALGILQDMAPLPGVATTQGGVRLFGCSKLVLAGTVTPGQFIKSDAAGAGLAATVDKDVYNAVAMTGGVSGDLVRVLIQHGTISA